MTGRRRLLITGATGLLGSYLLRAASRTHEVLATYRAPLPSGPGLAARWVHLDLRDTDKVKDLFATFRPEAVVHLASLGDVDYCEKHPEEARESILGWTTSCIEAADRSTWFCYVSSNAVFSGSDAPYDEESVPDPVNHYGRLKLAAERLVSDRDGPCAIVRPILAYGWPLPGRRDNPVTWLIRRLREGRRTPLVMDTWSNPLYAGHFAQVTLRILEASGQGVFHVAGAERLSRFEFGLRIAGAFDLPADLLDPVASSFFPQIAPRPRDTTYVTAKAERELGISPVDVATGLRSMRLEKGDV